ncbi:MAG: biotin/lipoyl-binding protein [Selenomonadaceae bacterium]|nr:biotin/lipoyl-binding protein [Selenomonadaceae bacterium]
MQQIDITAKITKIIRYSLVGIILLAFIIGYAEFKYWHKTDTIQLDNAKVVGTMVSVRVLANGKVKELTFEDGAQVEAGDVIAKLEVNITDEEIQQLENTVQLAKDNYARLQEGQMVSVPVQRQRVIPGTPATSGGGSSGNLAKLEERAKRMADLFEMGAVSAVERDAAQRAYENALASGGGGGGSAGTPDRIEYYTEYVDEFRPTPPEVLAGAEQAIKQAELSLNVALQESRETDVIAPISGTIYYGVEIDQELAAGDSVSRIGDSRNLWIEAEVSEDVFNEISLGKLAKYKIAGREIIGTVMEKIKPDEKQPEENSEENEPIDLPEIPTTENPIGGLLGQTPADGETSAQPVNGENPAQPVNGETPAQPADGETPAQPADGENPAQPADGENPAQPTDGETPAQPVNGENPAQPADAATPVKGEPPKLPEGNENQHKPNDKFIVKISLPAERDFDCRPNLETVVTIINKK